ncbi:MAG: hypothetical protein QTN59_18870 [Candidatus Electrothrix communis]|nr:MAG: hypothetical protein QTN59_18870 [Candidatus Electrothrix communis]
MRSKCSAGASCPARMARAVLPMPPGPSIRAPQVLASGEIASATLVSSLVRPKKRDCCGRLERGGAIVDGAGF